MVPSETHESRSERWARLQDAFHRLADASPEVQAAQLTALAAADSAFASELAAMLEADAGERVLLDDGLASMASVLLSSASSIPEAPFGPYRVTRVIGAGGSGIVYHGVRDDLQSAAAIKVLRDAWLSPQRRARFLFEQRTLASLTHPHIARLYEAGQLADGTPWYALEYVDGQPVTQWCSERRTPLRDRLRMFETVCEAVRYAHGRGVIHRDLKPSNILVDHSGSVRLLDFGIARRVQAGADHTDTGVRSLTPAYASPEQLRGAPADVQQDVYALGIVLFELLAGQRPYDVSALTTSDAAQVIETRAASSPLARTTHGSSVNESHLSTLQRRDLDAIVHFAMHPDPSRRYATVDALLRDLRAFHTGAPIEARRDSIAERLRRTLKRRRRELLIGALLIAAPVTVAVAYTTALGRARDRATEEAQRTARLTTFLTRILSGNDPDAGPADTLRVVTVVDEAVREVRALSADNAERADLLVLLGRVALQLGRVPLADSLLAQGEREQWRLAPAGSRRVVEAGVLRAQIHLQRGAADSAVRRLHDLARVARSITPPDTEAQLLVLEGLGAAYQETGQLDSAATVLASLTHVRGLVGRNDLAYAQALTALSNVQFYRSAYDSSRQLAAEALRITEARLGPEHPSLAEDLVNIGMVALRQGRPAEGEAPLRRALAVTQGWYGDAHPRVAGVITQLAQILMEIDKTPEALELLERAVRLQRDRYGPNSPRLASALNALAIAAGRSGDRERELSLTREAHATYARANGPDHFFTLVVAGNLGSMLSRLGRHDEAAAVLGDAVARFDRTVSPTDQNRAIALLRFGQARWRAGRYRDAIALSERGLTAYRATVTSPTGFSKAGSAVLAKSWAALGDSARAAQFARDSL